MSSSAGFFDISRFRGAFEGSISGYDSDFSQRPYHKNCRCALHDKSRRLAGAPATFPAAGKCNSVSFSVHRSPSEGSLALAASSSAATAASFVGPYIAWEKLKNDSTRDRNESTTICFTLSNTWSNC